MQSTNETIAPGSIDSLVHLPGYAGFLLDHKLDAFAQTLVQIASDFQFPIARYFEHFSAEQLLAFTRDSAALMLGRLKEGRTSEHVQLHITEWEEKKPAAGHGEVRVEDIALSSFIRKKAFLQFMPEYCAEATSMLALIAEIDAYLLLAQNAATSFYVEQLRKKINEHAHFIERITDATPGIIYVFDIVNNREVYANQSTAEFLGYKPEELQALGSRLVAELIHPDDHPRLKAHDAEMEGIKDGEVRSFRYRMRNKKGEYRWLRTSETVFKRNSKGAVIEKIGIAIDVHEQKLIADELKRKEQLYRQAQALAHVGNWSWNIEANEIFWSDELFRIFGLPLSASISFEQYIGAVHPEDRPMLETLIQAALKNLQPYEVTHRIFVPGGQVKIIQGRGEVLANAEGIPYMMVGSAQDVTQRENLITKLRESEMLYKQAQVLAKLGNWTLDLETRAVLWSEQMYQIYELPVGTPVGLDYWRSMIHPEEAADELQYLDDCIQQLKSYDRVHRIVLPNGKVKTLHRKAEFLFNKAGKATTMIGTTQDITDEFSVQQELKENQTFIRKITDATPSIISSYNVHNGKYVFVSEGVQKLLGYHKQAFLDGGIPLFTQLLHPDDAAEVREKNLKALTEANEHPNNNSLVAEFTYRLKHQNGHYRWFHTYATIFDRNADGQVEHVLNITLDVTDQKQAAEKIKEQEHFIQQIADASPTILYLFDVESQSMIYVNREVFFVLGYVPEEMLEEEGNITDLLYHPDDMHLLPGRKQSQKNFQQVDSMIQYECRLKGREGEWRWFLVREIVFKTNEKGEIKQILGAALDINRRKEMERTILQNTLQLEQSNSSLEEFAYVASHDLKEPLRKISTFGDRLMASQASNLNDEGRLYLKKIIEASQRMQTMISDLLSISMISGNRSFEPYSLQKILDETLQTLEYKIEQQNALITATELPVAHIVPSQFRQLFQNLLSNSLKFVQPGVQPVISIIHSLVPQEQLVHYQLTNAPQYLKIVFKDNGIGFENEFAGKIFTIFHRLHGRSEYEGSGIGLAICKKIVTHHGGIIYAESELEKGATFTIILPA